MSEVKEVCSPRKVKGAQELEGRREGWREGEGDVWTRHHCGTEGGSRAEAGQRVACLAPPPKLDTKSKTRNVDLSIKV